MQDTQEVVFTALDRCDSCGAQARVRVEFTSGELLFCGHHSRKLAQGLEASAVRIHDPEGYL